MSQIAARGSDKTDTATAGRLSGVTDLNVYRYGRVDGPVVLALHGLTGHGKRWESFANEHLVQARVLAPDLIGHGRSPWTPPWSFEAHIDSLVTLLKAETSGPVVVVGHSFGGAIGLHLAQRHPDLVRALVLLDPAIALNPRELLDVAAATVEHPDYTDAAEARSEKVHGAWADVPQTLLDSELAEHLVPTANGRVGWRLSIPAVTASWGEMARDFVLPPVQLRTVLVQAMRVQPPYVTPAFRTALNAHLGDNLTVHEFHCEHMVPLALPAETAALVRALL